MIPASSARAALARQHRRLVAVFGSLTQRAKGGDDAPRDAVGDMAVATLAPHVVEEEAHFARPEGRSSAEEAIILVLRDDHARMQGCIAEMTMRADVRPTVPRGVADLVSASRSREDRGETTTWVAGADEPDDGAREAHRTPPC